MKKEESLNLLKTLPFVGKLAEKILDRAAPDKAAARAEQAALDRAELEGAPPSRLRLWRSFLGWVLALCFVWEVVLRPALLTWWPGLRLPPSSLDAVEALLLGMLGLGF